MSNQADENPTSGIGDEQLPDELVPGEDNPLAEGLGDGETVDDLMQDGKPAEQSATDADQGRQRDEDGHRDAEAGRET